jgi:hypothetical protein
MNRKCILQNCPYDNCETHCNHMFDDERRCNSKYHITQHHNGPCERFESNGELFWEKCNYCTKNKLTPYTPVVITEIKCSYCGAEFDHDTNNCYLNPLNIKKEEVNIKKEEVEEEFCPYCQKNYPLNHHICPVKKQFYQKSTSHVMYASPSQNYNSTNHRNNSNTNITNTPLSSANYSLKKQENLRQINNNSTINPKAEERKNSRHEYDYNKSDDEIERELNVQQFSKITPNRYNTVYAFNILFNLSEKKSYFLACYKNPKDKNNFQNKGKLWNQGGLIDDGDGILKTLCKKSMEEAGIDVSRASQIIQIQFPPEENINQNQVASFLNIFYENNKNTFPFFNGPDRNHQKKVINGNELSNFYEQFEYKNGVAWVLINEIKDRSQKNMDEEYIYPNIGDSLIVKLLLKHIIQNGLLIDYVNQYKSTRS